MRVSTGMNNSRILKNSMISAVVLALTVLLEELLFFYGLTSQNLIMVYILSILIIASLTDGYIYGILTTIAGTFIFDFLVTEPRMGFSFTIGFPITLLIMLAVSLISYAITTRMKVHVLLAKEGEKRTKLMYEINQNFLATRDIQEIVRLASEYLDEHMGCPSVFYTRDQTDSDSFAIIQATGTKQDIALFHSKAQCQKANGILEDPHRHLGGLVTVPPISYIPLLSKDSVLGLVGIIGLDDHPDLNRFSFLQMLTGQVAIAIECQYAFAQQQSIRIKAENEKTRGILLRAISHDLRTPLTGIVSAASIIDEQVGSLYPSDIKCLASDIKNNSEWLIRMVENLLTVTRISEGAIKVRKTLEVAEEIMAQSVSIVRKRFPGHRIYIKAVEEPLLIPMDAILISQVLINLLENAAKNSPPESPVRLDLHKRDDYVKFDVNDQGKGIPDRIINNLFEVYVSGQDQTIDSVNGIGIGLSICKTIIDAHDGKITGYNKPTGGAVFTIMLPLN